MSVEEQSIHDFDFALICDYFSSLERQGLDLFPEFVERFTEHAQNAGFEARMKGIVGSMEDLPFPEAAFDLIWSEGAIYNIGFQRGLREWRRYLKPQAYIAVSEASWFTSERPAEIHDYWMDAYPEIDTIPNKVAQMQAAGYVPVATFILPESCWTDHFYVPQIAAQKRFLEKHEG